MKKILVFLWLILLMLMSNRLFLDEKKNENVKEEAIEKSIEISTLIKNENYNQLFKFAYPGDDLYFLINYAKSPYYKRISLKEYEYLLTSDKKDKWITIPPKNEIRITVKEFFRTYIKKMLAPENISIQGNDFFDSIVCKYDEYKEIKNAKNIIMVRYKSKMEPGYFKEYNELCFIFKIDGEKLYLSGFFYDHSPDISVSSAGKNFKLSAEEAKLKIGDKGIKIAECLNLQKWSELSDYVHPVKGIDITIFPEIKSTTPHFSRDELKDKNISSKEISTGIYPAAGGPIITEAFSEYISNFIYKKKYLSAPQINYNKISSSVSIVPYRWFIAYPNAVNVEFYYPNKQLTRFEDNKDKTDVDWWSLQLYFEEYNGEWYLVCIMHNSSAFSGFYEGNLGYDL